MNSEQLIFILDKIGILAFAFGGISIGIKKKLDVFGLLLLGVINAVGGGIIRDLTLARVPFAVSHVDYLEFALGASLLAMLLFYLKLLFPNSVIIITDTLGLGAFAAAGAAVAINAHLSIFHTAFLAITTAVGGGIIRDMLINEVPFILKREIYATAAAIGGVSAHLLVGVGTSNAILIGALVTIVIRFYSIKKNLNLPILR